MGSSNPSESDPLLLLTTSTIGDDEDAVRGAFAFGFKLAFECERLLDGKMRVPCFKDAELLDLDDIIVIVKVGVWYIQGQYNNQGLQSEDLCGYPDMSAG